jgi:hypothetical protein
MSKILMVRRMSRVERKKIKKENKIKRIQNFLIGILSFLFLITLLYTGIIVVDETNRAMMWMDESHFLSYSKLDEKNMEVIFCGDKYLVNIEKISILGSYIKGKMKYGINNVIKFAHDKGKVVTELVDNVFNNKIK